LCESCNKEETLNKLLFFASNEKTDLSISQRSQFELKNWHVLPGSLYGQVVLGNKTIQIYKSELPKDNRTVGSLSFTNCGEVSKVRCVRGWVDYEDGIVNLEWNSFVPGDHHLVSYYGFIKSQK
jgi:hypothetical protein